MRLQSIATVRRPAAVTDDDQAEAIAHGADGKRMNSGGDMS
ncbi:MAG: hypothetical protein ACRDP9_13170 [Kribbellaceae bacterium]